MIFAQSYKNLSYLQKKKGNFSSFIKEKQYLCTLINQKYDMPQTLHIAIIGGGAAGFFAAIEAKRNFPHADITIFEKNSKVLAKVEITGGGRCNLTNSFDGISDLKQAYPRGHKLMKRLFKRFDYQHAFDWFEENGVPLVTQADQCVFPQSQDSQSIIDCLVNTAKRLGVKIHATTSSPPSPNWRMSACSWISRFQKKREIYRVHLLPLIPFPKSGRWPSTG